MHAVYVACLFGGTLATALLVLLGAVGGVGHAHSAHGSHSDVGHAHIGDGHAGHAHGAGQHGGHQAGTQHGSHAGGADVDAASQAHLAGAHGSALHSFGGWMLGLLSPLSLAAAALWFGLGGLLGEQLGVVALIVAIVAAILGVMFVRVVADAFVRASVEPLSLTAEGAIGTVNAAIRDQGTGEVVYTLEGLRGSSPARSIDGRAIPRGTAVVIVRRERGIAYVEALDPLLDEIVPTALPAGDSRVATDPDSEVSRPR